jgi:tol-pal system protein YbgF
MKSTSHISAAVWVLLAISSSWAGTTSAQSFLAASNKELEARANATDQKIEVLERGLQALAVTPSEIEAVRQELRLLKGQLEELRFELGRLEEQQRTLYKDLDRRLLILESLALSDSSSTASASRNTAAPPTEILPTSEAKDAQELYAAAFAAMKAGQYLEAAQQFEVFLTKYPQSDKAENAWFWQGEALLMQADYLAAGRMFMTFIERYPQSKRLPDARYRLGLCLKELNNLEGAQVHLQEAVRLAPNTDLARQAQELLLEIEALLIPEPMM